MPTREEKLAFIQSQMGQQGSSNGPSREDKIAFIQSKMGGSDQPAPESQSILDSQIPVVGGSVRGLVKSGLNSLPIAGMIAGGSLGSMVEPGGGTILGAGAGGGIGAQLKAAGEKYILGEDRPSADVAKETVHEIQNGLLAETGGMALTKGASYLAETPLGKAAISKVGSGLAKIGETLSGASQQEIKTYAQHANEIKAMAQASDNNTAEAADQLRAKFGQSIDATRSKMNSQISTALKNSSATVESTPILQSLSDVKATIDPDLNPEQIAQIDGLAEKVRKLSNPDGTIDVQRANSLKQYLQDEAKAAYRNPGQSQLGTRAAQAAKGAAATARQAINVVEPDIAAANEKLAHLHDIEDTMNMNLVTEGKPESGLLAAGTGGNARNAKALSQLGEATGTDMLGDAQKLAAMRTFGSPKLIAADATGKSLARMLTGAGAVGVATHSPTMMVLGGLLSSPASVKYAIDAGALTAKALANPELQSIMGKAMVDHARQYMNEKDMPAPMATPGDSSPVSPKLSNSNQDQAAATPTKGPAKWASDGIDNLVAHASDPSIKAQLVAAKDDPKTKDLLIQASDLKPGSAAMEKVLSQIKNRIAKGDK